LVAAGSSLRYNALKTTQTEVCGYLKRQKHFSQSRSARMERVQIIFLYPGHKDFLGVFAALRETPFSFCLLVPACPVWKRIDDFYGKDKGCQNDQG
jgi:hypothetical protein